MSPIDYLVKPTKVMTDKWKEKWVYLYFKQEKEFDLQFSLFYKLKH